MSAPLGRVEATLRRPMRIVGPPEHVEDVHAGGPPVDDVLVVLSVCGGFRDVGAPVQDGERRLVLPTHVVQLRHPGRKTRPPSGLVGGGHERGVGAPCALRVAGHAECVGVRALDDRWLVLEGLPDDPLDEPGNATSIPPAEHVLAMLGDESDHGGAVTRHRVRPGRGEPCPAVLVGCRDRRDHRTRRRTIGVPLQQSCDRRNQDQVGRAPHPPLRHEHALTAKEVHQTRCAGATGLGTDGVAEGLGDRTRSVRRGHRAQEVLRPGGQGVEHAGSDPVRGRGTRCRERRRQVDVGVTAECVPGEVSEHRPPAGEVGDAQRGVGVRDAVLLGQQAGDLVRRESKVGGVPLAHLPRQARTGRGVER